MQMLLKQKFHDYFFELEGYSLRAERFYNDLSIEDKTQLAIIRKEWLEAAFMEGAQTVLDMK